MSTEFVYFVVVPMIIFFLTVAGTGITFLIRGSAYMARSQVAQESTAKSNAEIQQMLVRYIEKNDERVSKLDLRLTVLESREKRER